MRAPTASVAASADVRFVHSQSCVANPVGDQVFMMSLEQGKYFAVQAVAKQVWDMLAVPMSIASIAAALTERYDVSQEQCLVDVETFIESLCRTGLIIAAPSCP